MPQAFLESGIRRRLLHLGCPPHRAGEPLFNAAGCPQCGESRSLRPDNSWNDTAKKWRYGEELECTACGLQGIRPHFAGVAEEKTP